MNQNLIKPVIFVVCLVIFTVYSTLVNAASFSKEYFYDVTVTNVYDGDTITIESEIWPQHFIKTNIRMYGIDTPEKTWRAKCEKEKVLALLARDYLKLLLDGASERLYITGIKPDKYNKRFVAKLMIGNNSVSDMMISSGHAVEYFGKGIKKDWCI